MSDDQIPLRAIDLADGSIPPSSLDTTGADAVNDTLRFNPTTGQVEYATSGGSSGSTPSAGEALMVDGASPPENVTNETADDWLYEG